MPVTPNAVILPVTAVGIQPTRTKFSSRAKTSNPQPRTVRYGKKGEEGPISIECSKESLTTPYKAHFGAPRTSGAAGWYAHEFYYQVPMLSTFIEKRHSDIANTFMLA